MITGILMSPLYLNEHAVLDISGGINFSGVGAGITVIPVNQIDFDSTPHQEMRGIYLHQYSFSAPT